MTKPHEGMPAFDQSGEQLSFFEFWPMWAFYPPVMLYALYLMLRYRGILLPTVANPSFPGGGFVGESKADKFLAWAGDRLWLFNQKGSASQDAILGAISWSAEHRGVKHFVIDNLMMVTDGESGERAMNSQKTFIEKLKRCADDVGVHVHLVHHVRKGESESDRPNKFDLKGSGAIADLSDQIFIVWRNKKREAYFQHPNRKPDPELEAQAGATLAVVKNRRVGIEKSYALWFDRASRQFSPTSDARPFDLTLGEL